MLHCFTILWISSVCTQGQGKIEVPLTAQPGVVPSIYTGHPSYAYPADKTYAEDRAYPGTIGFPACVEGPSTYPGGAPSLGNHSGAPAPTGFPRLDSRGFVYWNRRWTGSLYALLVSCGKLKEEQDKTNIKRMGGDIERRWSQYYVVVLHGVLFIILHTFQNCSQKTKCD